MKHQFVCPRNLLVVIFSLALAAGEAPVFALAPGNEGEKPDETQKTERPPRPRVKQSGQADAERETPVIALIGAEIRTLGPEGTLADGVVLIRGERIEEVGGRDLDIPNRATRIDVAGAIMTPGLIDARSELWLTRAAAGSTASDAALNVLDGMDAFAEDWPEVVRHGITTVYVQPSRRATLGGYGAVLSVAPRVHGPVVFKEYAALQASLGIGAGNNRNRQQQYDRTKKVLDAAADYRKKWDAYEAYVKKQEEQNKRSKAKGRKKSSDSGKGQAGEKQEASGRNSRSGRPPSGGSGRGGSPQRGSGQTGNGDSKKPDGNSPKKDAGAAEKGSQQTGKPDAEEEKPPKKPDRDPAKDRLVQVLQGETPLRLEIHNADDAHFALKLMKEFKDVQVVLDGVTDLRSAADTVSDLRVPLVLGPWLEAESLFRSGSTDNWSDQFASYGGVLSIASFGSGTRSSRLLRAHAAKAVAAGFDAERVLRALTLDAARLLGVDEQLGSIAKGKRADIVCFHGEPTNAASAVRLVVSGGNVVYENRDAQSMATDKSSQALLLPAILPQKYALATQRCLLENNTFGPRSIVIADGKITDIAQGSAASLKQEMVVFDLGDTVVTPGLFSAHTTLGLERTIDPSNQPDAGYVVAADGVSSGTDRERKMVQGGVLRALLAPGDSNPIAGMAGVIRLGAEDLVARSDAAFKLVLSSGARSLESFPSSLAGQTQLLSQSILGELLPSRVYLPPAVEGRLAARRQTALAALVDGKQLVILVAEIDAEIRSALDLIERHGLRAALVGARQLEPFIHRIRSLNVSVIARPITAADYDWYAADLAAASEAGIPIAFAAESPEQLRLTAALAVEAGLGHDAALGGLFQSPTELFGVSDVCGWSDGAPADLVLWSDSPVHIGAKPLKVIVDGQIMTDEDR